MVVSYAQKRPNDESNSVEEDLSVRSSSCLELSITSIFLQSLLSSAIYQFKRQFHLLYQFCTHNLAKAFSCPPSSGFIRKTVGMQNYHLELQFNQTSTSSVVGILEKTGGGGC